MPRRVQVDAHPEIEIRLRLAAHDCRQVKDRRRLCVDRALEELSIGDVARDLPDAAVGQSCGRHDVDQRDPVDARVAAVGPAEHAALEQRFGQAPSEKSRSSGDDDVHAMWRPWRQRVNHPSPSSVRPAGRYSQPTQPAYPNSSIRSKRYP